MKRNINESREQIKPPEPLRILLGEGDTEDGRLLLLALTGAPTPMEVTVVSSGERFCELLERTSFDCAVLADSLANTNGGLLMDDLRPGGAGCPLVAVSSNRDQDFAIDCLRKGCVDFVPKKRALAGEELAARVAHAVERHRSYLGERRKQLRRERQLVKLAETDPLTETYNRRFFDRCRAEGRWRDDRRRRRSIVMIDIDHFKSINDEFGHETGDRVLNRFAEILRRSVTNADSVIRWGGEEFMLVLESQGLLTSWMWAERLRESVSHLVIPGGHRPIKVTASLGLKEIDGDIGEAEVEAADAALYLAKGGGRNRVCTTDMVALEADLADVRLDQSSSLLTKRRMLLDRVKDRVGPTQWEHISEHCERVSETAVAIARQLGLPGRTVEHLRVAGLLHDIGKLVIPEGLLSMPRSLMIEEWRLMCRHEIYSEWITRSLGANERILQYVAEHHRRFDQIENPDGSLATVDAHGGGVLCLADTIATMLSGRCYRPSSDVSEVVREMDRCRGSQFDPVVTDAATLWLQRREAMPLALAA